MGRRRQGHRTRTQSRAFEQKLIYNICSDGADVMRTWLRSLVNAILGKVPGKTSRLDTATRRTMDDGRGFQRSPGVNAPWAAPPARARRRTPCQADGLVRGH